MEVTAVTKIVESSDIKDKSLGTIKGVKQNPLSQFCRVTVVEQIYHETPDGPYQVPTEPFTRDLVSDEQTYPRIVKVGEDWQEINTGWLEGRVSMLYIKNLEGKMGAVYPTDEEKKATGEKVIEVGLYLEEAYGIKVFSVIPVTESIRVIPSEISRYRIRCRKGVAKVQISAVPS